MTTARPILGRGLDALIARSPEPRDAPAPRRVAIDRIDPNPEQPRGAVEPAALEELAASIRSVGILQPLLVTPAAGDRFTLVAGERRWRAARLAGLWEVPVVVTSLAGDELLTAALVENLQREDLSPLEEAAAYARLLAATGESQARIAERVGKSRSAIANALRLLGLPAPIRDSLARGEISEGHARALLAVTDASAREQLWRRVVAEGLNVRQTERAARAAAGRDGDSAPAIDDIESQYSERDGEVSAWIERALGTRVRLHRGAKGGTLEIRWYDDEQLHDLAARLAAATETPPPPPAQLTI
jgi:ParB family chromosome partitioning protein